MSSKSFIDLFGDVAHQETRTVQIRGTIPGRLPADDYGFSEWYCVDAACDLRKKSLFLT